MGSREPKTALAFTWRGDGVTEAVAMLWNPSMALVPAFGSYEGWNETLRETAGTPERYAAIEKFLLDGSNMDSVVEKLSGVMLQGAAGMLIGSKNDAIPAKLRGLKISIHTHKNLALLYQMTLKYKSVICILAEDIQYSDPHIWHGLMQAIAPDTQFLFVSVRGKG